MPLYYILSICCFSCCFPSFCYSTALSLSFDVLVITMMILGKYDILGIDKGSQFIFIFIFFSSCSLFSIFVTVEWARIGKTGMFLSFEANSFRFRLLPYNRSWTQAGPSRNLLHEEYEGGQKIAGFNGKKGYHSRFQGSCSFPRDWGLCSWVFWFCGRLCCEFCSASASQVMWKWDDLTGFRFFDFPLFYWFLFILVLCSLLLDRSFYSKIICDLFFIRSFSIFRVFPLFIEFMSILLYWITTSSVGNGFVIGVEQNKDLEKKYDFTSF